MSPQLWLHLKSPNRTRPYPVSFEALYTIATAESQSMETSRHGTFNGMTAESQLSYQIQIQRDKFKVLQMILHQTPKASAAVYLSSVIGGESTPIWSEDCGNMLKPPQIAGPWQLRILYSNVEQLHPFLYWILHIAGTCHWPYGDYPR